MCVTTDRRRSRTSAVKAHLQRIVEAPVVVSRPRQEGGRDGGARGRGDVQQGAAGGAGGLAAESRRRDAGEVDAQREAGLFQGFLRHGEGLQLLLAIGHVGVLAATADTVQTCLRAARDLCVNDDKMHKITTDPSENISQRKSQKQSCTQFYSCAELTLRLE